MVITVYISGISGNKEVKKRQQRVQMILESKSIDYEAVDIAEPGRQTERDRLKTCGATPPVLPPQMFNGDDYCGDYDQFDLANENDTLEAFLKLAISNNVSNDVTRISPEVNHKEPEETNAEETAVEEPAEEEQENEEVKEEERKQDDEIEQTNADEEANENETKDADKDEEEEVEAVENDEE